MIAINKKEADAIRARYPDVHIVRTMRQKSKRHRYYCVETKPVMRLLDKLRTGKDERKAKEGGRHKFRKNGKRNSA